MDDYGVGEGDEAFLEDVIVKLNFETELGVISSKKVQKNILLKEETASAKAQKQEKA